MTPHTIISHYNHLNGKPVKGSTLREFHHEIQRYLDKNGTGPHTKTINAIRQCIAKAVKTIAPEEVVDVTVKKLRVPGSGLQVEKKPKKKTSKKKSVQQVADIDETLLAGIEHIQNDKEVDGQPLDGIGDTTYKVITDKILALIKKDGLIWRKPWNAGTHSTRGGQAHNYVTKHFYRGTNYYLNYLLLDVYKSPYFFTFRQIEQKGGKVKKDEKGHPVIYFKWLYKKTGNGLVDESQALEGNKLKPGYEKFPGLFYYTVFNFDQCEGLKIKPFKAPKPLPEKEQIESAEKIVDGMPKRPVIHKNGTEAFYSPLKDSVTMPPMKFFEVDQQYYSVLFHELIHSTGAKERIGRPIANRFGTKPYAFEELIAELGASYLCGDTGILYYTLDNTAAYIQNWSTMLKKEMEQDPKFFVRASAEAEKAARFIVGDTKLVPVELIKEEEDKPIKQAAGLDKIKVTKKVKKKVDRTAAKKKPVTSNLKPVTKSGLSRASDLAGLNFFSYELSPQYQKDFHKLNSDTNVMIWGKPGHGKTVYLMQFAQDLASRGSKVLYISEEEFGKSTLAEKIRKFNIGHDNLYFAGHLDENILSDFDVIFFDSINSLGLAPKDIKRLEKQHPNKLFVLIVQTTKEGNFRGGQDWEHLVDVAGEIRNRKLILEKNRFDEKNSEKMERLLTDDAITEAKKRAEIRRAVKEGLQPEVPAAPQPGQQMTIL